MAGTETQVSDVAGELQRVLAKVMSVLRHTGKTATAGDLTLAQLSILLTLLDQGPMRMTELAAHERVRTPTTTVAIRRLETRPGQALPRPVGPARGPGRDHPQGLSQHRDALASRQAHLAQLLSKLNEE